MSDYEIFNKQSTLLLEYLLKLFPNDSKIKRYKFGFDSLRSISTRKPLEFFMSSAEPYGQQIMSKDDNFFNVEAHEDQMGIAEHWGTLGVEYKNEIWKHMQILYVLGMKILNKGEELAKIYNSIKNN